MQKNCRFLIPKAALHIEVEGEAGIWSWGQYHKAYRRKAFGGKEGRAHTSWLVVSPQEWSVTCKWEGAEVIWKEELKWKCLGHSAKPHLNSSVNNSALRSNLSLPHAALRWKTSKKEEKTFCSECWNVKACFPCSLQQPSQSLDIYLNFFLTHSSTEKRMPENSLEPVKLSVSGLVWRIYLHLMFFHLYLCNFW